VRTDVETPDILAIDVEDRSYILLDPHGIDCLFIECGEMMDFMSAQPGIEGIALEDGKSFLR
jgi:hypothetical protein